MSLSRRGNSTTKRGSFRAKVVHNSQQQLRKESNYGHLVLPKGVSVFKEEAGGRISLDILPYFVTDEHHPDRDDDLDVAVVGSLWYKRPYRLHRSVGVENASVVCPTSVGRKCPICEYRTKRLSEGAEWKDKEITALRPSDRNLYYVVPKESRKFENKPYLWDISAFCFQKTLDGETAENDEFGEFPDPENGYTLNIRFSEEKVERNSFAKTSRIDFVERDYKYDDDVVKALPSLDDVIDVKDYREVERMFFESSDAPEENDASDEIGTRSPISREPESTEEEISSSAKILVLTRPRDRITASVKNEEEPDDAGKLMGSSTGARLERQHSAHPSPDRAKTDQPPASVNGLGECPSGHVFGVDIDSKPECDDCPVWSDCMDAKMVAN